MTDTARNNPKITLIGRDLAKPDTEFIYNGDIGECADCRLHKVCHNLIPGRRYRVLGLKNGSVHTCPVHNGGVCAVEVVPAPVPVLIDRKLAIQNSKITYENDCTERHCRNHHLCFPDGLTVNGKYLITDVGDDTVTDCLRHKIMKEVRLIDE